MAAAAGAGGPRHGLGVDPRIVAMSTWTKAGRDCSDTVYTLKGLCKIEGSEQHGDIGDLFDADKGPLLGRT